MNTIIFTDGSSRGNPGSGGYGAIIFEDKKVQEIGGGEKDTTNNRMEMMAAISAIQKVSGISSIDLYTDSAYLINGITKWVWGWQKNNWQTKTKEDVLNKDLWQMLMKVCSGKQINWVRVSGHSGVPANERCDVIATSFADGKKVELFHGDVGDYGIDLSTVVGNDKKISSKSNKNAKAYSYISKVDGVIQTHETWSDTEARVKGKSGARFKKSVSKEDEAKIISEFSN